MTAQALRRGVCHGGGACRRGRQHARRTQRIGRDQTALQPERYRTDDQSQRQQRERLVHQQVVGLVIDGSHHPADSQCRSRSQTPALRDGCRRQETQRNAQGGQEPGRDGEQHGQQAQRRVAQQRPALCCDGVACHSKQAGAKWQPPLPELQAAGVREDVRIPAAATTATSHHASQHEGHARAGCLLHQHGQHPSGPERFASRSMAHQRHALPAPRAQQHRDRPGQRHHCRQPGQAPGLIQQPVVGAAGEQAGDQHGDQGAQGSAEQQLQPGSA